MTAEIKLRCKEMWLQLQELQGEIQNCQTVQTPDDGGMPGGSIVMSSSLDIAASNKNALLEAQIQTLENTPISSIALPDDLRLLGEVLKSDLSQGIVHLQATEKLLLSQRSKLEEEIARVNELKAQLSKFKTGLEERKKAVNANEMSGEQAAAELQHKNEKLKSICESRQLQLNEFLEKHYPPPSADQVKDWCKNHGVDPKMANAKFVSLRNIVELLMKRCTDSPEDPFVHLDETYWPPYVELLLRSGIATRHSEISDKIAMIPYHL